MTSSPRQCIDCQAPLPDDVHRNTIRCWTCSRKRTDKLRRIGELKKMIKAGESRIEKIRDKNEEYNQEFQKLVEELDITP